MPRTRQALADVARTYAVRDRALAIAAGEDVDDEEASPEWTLAAFSARLREDWRRLDLEKRRLGLRNEIKAKFLRRFGIEWSDRRRATFASPPWPPPRMPAQRSRSTSTRSRLVTMLDFENQLYLPPRPDGSSRFLSVLELTWVSLLAGNWPSAARRRAPDAVLRAERELIKKALARYGQRPAEALGVERLRRGPQVRELSRKK